MEIVGWLGATLFAICGFPQALQSIRDGHSDGLNWMFLLTWLSGEILTMVYVFPKADYPLLFNYSLNLIFLTIIIWYKIFNRKLK